MCALGISIHRTASGHCSPLRTLDKFRTHPAAWMRQVTTKSPVPLRRALQTPAATSSEPTGAGFAHRSSNAARTRRSVNLTYSATDAERALSHFCSTHPPARPPSLPRVQCARQRATFESGFLYGFVLLNSVSVRAPHKPFVKGSTRWFSFSLWKSHHYTASSACPTRRL